MLGKHLLTCADHVLALSQGRGNDLEGGPRFIDHFHDHIDLRIEKKRVPTGREKLRRSLPFLSRVLVADLFYRSFQRGGLLQYFIQTFAYYAKSKQADAEPLMCFH